MTTQEDIEAAARAMALVDGWDAWDTATGFNDTLSGNAPEDERAHYRDLAVAALSAPDPLLDQMAEALETFVKRFSPNRSEYLYSKRAALNKAEQALAAYDARRKP